MDLEQHNFYKVRLTSSSSNNRLEDIRRSVTFDVTPDLIENRNINYKTIDPLHAPGQIFIYQNSSARTFNLSNVRLVSRNPQEATKNLIKLWTLRGWTVPNFGRSSYINGRQAALDQARRANPDASLTDLNEMIRDMENNINSNRSNLGAPPQVLYLSAYSKPGSTTPGHIKRVPVLIQQLSIPYPSDIDYIPTDDPEDPIPMPTIMTLDMTLTESHSPREYEQFSLQEYKTGTLPGF